METSLSLKDIVQQESLEPKLLVLTVTAGTTHQCARQGL